MYISMCQMIMDVVCLNDQKDIFSINVMMIVMYLLDDTGTGKLKINN